MLNFLVWTTGTLVAGIIGVALTVVFEEPIKWWIYQRSKKKGRRPNPILGMWHATFTIVEDGNTRAFSEIIELRHRYFLIEGFVIPDSKKHPEQNADRRKWPLRVEGELSDNHFFTGEWFHPLKLARFRGSFQLVLDPFGTRMEGKWIGFSQSLNEISTGVWVWIKVDEPKFID